MDDILPPDPAPEVPPADTTAELRKRVADLEQELAAVTAHRDRLRADYRALWDEVFPFEPMTEEEARALMAAPPGQPILEIIEEFERRPGSAR